MGMNDLCTPSRSVGNLKSKNQENRLPKTPLGTAQDSQYKEWLQRNGFLQLFRNSNQLNSVIKILRHYSDEVCCKVQQVLNQNNELKEWRTEIGEPALQNIERYKLIEKELKKQCQELTEEY